MNITNAGRRKGHETSKQNITMTSTGGIRDPIKTYAAFERVLNGRCFCPRGKHKANCKVDSVN